ncbi:hypothetical protein TNCV_233041 [Trichonephila clavipes]|nr:hypothetical protein TNCV_233041 [Trichonephila clavipes]
MQPEKSILEPINLKLTYDAIESRVKTGQDIRCEDPIAWKPRVWGDVLIANPVLSREELIYALLGLSKGSHPKCLVGPPVDCDRHNVQAYFKRRVFSGAQTYDSTKILSTASSKPWSFRTALFGNEVHPFLGSSVTIRIDLNIDHFRRESPSLLASLTLGLGHKSRTTSTTLRQLQRLKFKDLIEEFEKGLQVVCSAFQSNLRQAQTAQGLSLPLNYPGSLKQTLWEGSNLLERHDQDDTCSGGLLSEKFHGK